MMRNLFLLILITLSACSSDFQLEGTYKHKSCSFGSSCEYFEFFNDGRFRYNIISHTQSHDFFNGKWTRKADTIYLIPNKIIFPDSTVVETIVNKRDSKTNISICMLGGHEEGQKPDTSRVNWYVSLDGGDNYRSTDNSGNLSIKKQYIHKIKIQDIMEHMGQGKLFRHQDSIFYINAEVDEINIFLALSERQPEELKYMPNKLLMQGNNLYRVDISSDINYLKRSRNYFKRSKD